MLAGNARERDVGTHRVVEDAAMKNATPRCVTGFGARDGSTTTSARSTPSTSPPMSASGTSMSPRRALLAEALRSRAHAESGDSTRVDARTRRAPSEDSEYSCDENFVLKNVGVDADSGAHDGRGRDVDADVAVREQARDGDEGVACESLSRASSMPIDIPRGSDGTLHWKTYVAKTLEAARERAARGRADARTRGRANARTLTSG